MTAGFFEDDILDADMVLGSVPLALADDDCKTKISHWDIFCKFRFLKKK